MQCAGAGLRVQDAVVHADGDPRVQDAVVVHAEEDPQVQACGPGTCQRWGTGMEMWPGGLTPAQVLLACGCAAR